MYCATVCLLMLGFNQKIRHGTFVARAEPLRYCGFQTVEAGFQLTVIRLPPTRFAVRRAAAEPGHSPAKAGRRILHMGFGSSTCGIRLQPDLAGLMRTRDRGGHYRRSNARALSL
jgi:hypothetical protein